MKMNEYTIYVDQDDRVVNLIGHADKERIACYTVTLIAGDKITLIRANRPEKRKAA